MVDFFWLGKCLKGTKPKVVYFLILSISTSDCDTKKSFPEELCMLGLIDFLPKKAISFFGKVTVTLIVTWKCRKFFFLYEDIKSGKDSLVYYANWSYLKQITNPFFCVKRCLFFLELHSLFFFPFRNSSFPCWKVW